MNSSMVLKIDGFESDLIERNQSADAASRTALDVGNGEITQLASDCCGSNNYPT